MAGGRRSTRWPTSCGPALAWAAGDAERARAGVPAVTWLGRPELRPRQPGESQRRYEQAAELAPDDRAAAGALRSAAGAAEPRQFGNEALRLRRCRRRRGARAAATGPGRPADLARAAELINRGPGIMAVTSRGRARSRHCSREARPLAAGDPAAEARILTAEAFNGAEPSRRLATLVDRALDARPPAGDPLAESAALDLLTSIQLARGRVRPRRPAPSAGPSCWRRCR